VKEVVAVAAGAVHSLVLSRDGAVMACGRNSAGQLGLGDTDDRDTFTVVAGLRGVVDIDSGDDHTIAVTVEGGLYAWGTGRAIGHGGDPTTQRLVPTKVTGGGIEEVFVVQVAAGVCGTCRTGHGHDSYHNDMMQHSMALTTTGELYAWGAGGSGQLGHGGKEHLAVPRVVDGVGGAVTGMSGGDFHSLVTTAEGRVLTFGAGGNGRLGLGTVVVQTLTPTAIDGIAMGDGEEGKEGKE
jgi:alpha-tubulin suppressor-like RCC1 family protein